MQNRYEEYQNFEDKIPFMLIQNIKRNELQKSREANWHENLEVEYCISGEGRVLIDGREHVINRGDLTVINSGSIHHTGSDSEVVYSCIIIDTEFCKESGIDIDNTCFENLIHNNETAKIFEDICQYYNNKNDRLRTARLRLCTLKLLLLLSDKYSLPQERRTAESQNENAKKVIGYIRSRYAEKISLDSMAKELYMNKFVLSRQFKAVVGMTVFEYINSCRCNAAAMLIAEGQSISMAAEACGFENMSFFTKTFKRFMGRLPSDYKKTKQ